MSEHGERLIRSTEQALEIAKGTAKPGTYRISVFEDGELRVIQDVDHATLAELKSPRQQELKQQPRLDKTGG